MNYKHSGKLGDVLFALPVIQSCPAEERNLYLELGQHDPGGVLRLTEEGAAALLPLLRRQPCLSSVGLFEGQPIDVDLDLFRAVPCERTGGYLPRWYGYLWPLTVDLTKPWLEVEPDKAYPVVVSRTRQHRRRNLDYSFLADYGAVFLGLPGEHEGTGLPFVPTRDLHEAARIIAGCRLFVGNQGGLYAVAESLKVHRILEPSPLSPNIPPMGGQCAEVIDQGLFRATVERMLCSRS